jgi:hypothetical protein
MEKGAYKKGIYMRLNIIENKHSQQHQTTFLPTHTDVNQLTEQQIINLSSIFLTNGVHHISVTNKAEGRTLIYNFLHSLNYYHAVACLSLEAINEEPITDLFEILCSGNWLTKGNFEPFLCQELYADFLWIEETQEMLDSPWYQPFKDSLLTLGFDKNMPIILFTYREID